MKAIHFLKLLIFSFLLSSCVEPIDNDCSTTKRSVERTQELMVGRWQLKSLKVTNSQQVIQYKENLQLDIDNNQRVVVYKESMDVAHFRFTLQKSDRGIYYLVSESSVQPLIWLLETGRISVCTDQLVIDNSETDGPTYTYDKVN